MSITLADAQSILKKLIDAQACDPVGALGSVTVGGHTVTYKGADDLIKMINYWSRVAANLQRAAAGVSRTSFVLPNFSGRSR
jgi:hypothetical protein